MAESLTMFREGIGSAMNARFTAPFPECANRYDLNAILLKVDISCHTIDFQHPSNRKCPKYWVISFFYTLWIE